LYDVAFDRIDYKTDMKTSVREENEKNVYKNNNGRLVQKQSLED